MTAPIAATDTSKAMPMILAISARAAFTTIPYPATAAAVIMKTSPRVKTPAVWVAWAPASSHHRGPTVRLAALSASHWMANAMTMSTADMTGTDQFPFSHFWSLFILG